ncbi:phosphoglucomutase/phosphomannomutase [Neorhodopirellula lusitana]|uniref:Phosphoglucomutase/phosphomannomutase n=1 Tax=Neorhodopirellula lusitana TaxID=445327 RepID=A0ABY1QQF8_9BACT|nr:phospho-sugar mutase [Neorhodopirellula lusitana]SMP77653.1 phosphoglucomutase/phosphomannomutase [Neorhodopirellula lusitana]
MTDSAESTADPKRIQDALASVDQACEQKLLTAGAVTNIKSWLTEDRYSDYRESVLRHIDEKKWQKLDDVFWTIIPFGTGGRRGRMYEIGSNAINDRTIGESAQGLADYVVRFHGGKKSLSCAIAYDTRHQSRHFTELCAEVMVAAGIKVYLLDDYRATPQLSFAVRYLGCDCGIMVTASHNPPSDNAVKVYWSSGAQVLPPHDKAIIDGVMSCQEIKRGNFKQALADGMIEVVTDKIDAAFLDAASACAFEGPRDVKILYSPLHGVGEAAVVPLLQRDGFNDITVYEPHRERSGDFPNVPGHVSNPENPEVFTKPIEQARAEGFDVVLATDPDCDRLGVAAPLTTDSSGQWETFTGNQIAALLADYVLRKTPESKKNKNSFVVKTLVTTELVRRIADSYSVRCVGDLLVGYKYIAEAMDREGPDDFLYGCEESHGYLVGSYVRDKDGAVACMLMSELAADLKANNQSMHDYLGELFKKFGYHRENLVNVVMEGSEGMASMQALMKAFREKPPTSLGGVKVAQVRDYGNQTATTLGDAGESKPLEGPVGNLIIMDLEQDGNYVAVRPSGTEPKVKFYVFTRLDPAESQDLKAANVKLGDRIAAIEEDVRAFAKLATA